MPDEPTPPAPAPPKPPETFSSQYVSELRAENERLRNTLHERDGQIDDLKKTLDAEKKGRKEAVDAETSKWRTQIKHDKIAAALVREGFASENMAALVASKLATEAKIDWDDAGNLTNLKEGIEAFKKAEPSMFLAPGATTRNPVVPGQAPAAPKDMRTATPQEVATRLKEMGVHSI